MKDQRIREIKERLDRGLTMEEADLAYDDDVSYLLAANGKQKERIAELEKAGDDMNRSLGDAINCAAEKDRRIAELEAATQWRTDEPPRDGTRFLAITSEDQPPTVFRWNPEFGCFSGPDHAHLNGPPDYWLPIPDAPAEKGEDRG